MKQADNIPHLFHEDVAWDVLEADVIQETSHLLPDQHRYVGSVMVGWLVGWYIYVGSVTSPFGADILMVRSPQPKFPSVL